MNLNTLMKVKQCRAAVSERTITLYCHALLISTILLFINFIKAEQNVS